MDIIFISHIKERAVSIWLTTHLFIKNNDGFGFMADVKAGANLMGRGKYRLNAIHQVAATGSASVVEELTSAMLEETEGWTIAVRNLGGMSPAEYLTFKLGRKTHLTCARENGHSDVVHILEDTFTRLGVPAV